MQSCAVWLHWPCLIISAGVMPQMPGLRSSTSHTPSTCAQHKIPRDAHVSYLLFSCQIIIVALSEIGTTAMSLHDTCHIVLINLHQAGVTIKLFVIIIVIAVFTIHKSSHLFIKFSTWQKGKQCPPLSFPSYFFASFDVLLVLLIAIIRLLNLFSDLK